jgi:hypothetical protein
MNKIANKYILSIGANNDTKKLEIENIKYVVGEFCDYHETGFTLVESIGYWAGSIEKSCIVSIVSENDLIADVISLCNSLKVSLQQDSIMLEVLKSDVRFV